MATAGGSGIPREQAPCSLNRRYRGVPVEQAVQEKLSPFEAALRAGRAAAGDRASRSECALGTPHTCRQVRSRSLGCAASSSRRQSHEPARESRYVGAFPRGDGGGAGVTAALHGSGAPGQVRSCAAPEGPQRACRGRPTRRAAGDVGPGATAGLGSFSKFARWCARRHDPAMAQRIPIKSAPAG